MRLKVKVGVVLLSVAFIFTNCNKSANNARNTINPILGDVSFVNEFGIEPTEKTDEDLRIKTHLKYVEGVLRNNVVSQLSNHQMKNRERILDLLHEYWTKGIFPRNYDYQETRKPCFVDKEDRLCAVAYLIDQTIGRDVVVNINQQHKYDYILDMKNNMIDDWMENSGLTKTEYAMIQPSYDFGKETPVQREPIEELPKWNGNGKQKVFNKKKQLVESGWFKEYKLMKGKKYYYTLNGEIEKIEIYKEGKFIKNGELKEKKKLDKHH